MGIDRGSKRSPNVKDERKLTAKQRMFIAEYRADPTISSSEAARRSGYKNPSVAGPRTLEHPVVKRAVSALIIRQEERLQRTGDELIQRMWETEDFDPISIFKDENDGSISLRQLEDMDPRARRQITQLRIREKRRSTEDGDEVETDVEIKWVDKLKNREYLAKNYGLIDVEKGGGKDTITVNFLADFRAKVENPESVEVIDDGIIEARAVSKSNGRK